MTRDGIRWRRTWGLVAVGALCFASAPGPAAAATASPDSFTIEVQIGGTGVVTPSGFVTVPAGGSQTFSITPST